VVKVHESSFRVVDNRPSAMSRTLQLSAFVSAADRAMRACQEACRELWAMVETINADRAAQ